MRKLVAVTQVTLDGVMQAPGGPEEMAQPFDLVLGRKTYEIFAARWPFDEGQMPNS
jgi:dihydrofolate reductase